MSRFFLDTEFIEDGKTIELISIGIVADGGASYYGVSSECDYSKASEWVKTNVLPCVGRMPPKTRAEIRADIVSFIESYSGKEKPEFWGYYSAYDWVAFCQLFGTMMELPKGYPMYCRDLKQLCVLLGNPKLPEQSLLDGPEHHALSDARWNKRMYEFLIGFPHSPNLIP